MPFPAALRSALWVLPPLLVASLGWRNPVDGLVRGKWVRHWDTGKGEHTATLCVPAQEPSELPTYLAQLPEVVGALLEAGAAVVVLDLPLPTEKTAAAELIQVARDAAVVLRYPTEPGAADAFTRSAARGEGERAPQPVGHADMTHSWPPREVLGAAPPVEVDGRVIWPLALQAVAELEGVDGPQRDPATGHIVLGGTRFEPTDDTFIFMPYEVPFLHWDRRDEWAQARGRIVTVGACKVDRELTRFGRQPGPVAHGELGETVYDDVFPTQLPALVDLLLALLTWGLAWLGAAVGPARARWLLPLGVGVLGVLGLLLVSLTGAWLGLSGVAVAALTGWLAQGELRRGGAP